jgi:hypothetical protein
MARILFRSKGRSHFCTPRASLLHLFFFLNFDSGAKSGHSGRRLGPGSSLYVVGVKFNTPPLEDPLNTTGHADRLQEVYLPIYVDPND